MTSVQKLEWNCSLPSRRLLGERINIRSDLARVLQETNFSQALTDFTISLEDREPRIEFTDPGTFYEAGGSDEDLSIGVRRISQLPGLRKLALSTPWVLSPSAFGLHPRLPDIYCPALEYVSLNCATTTSDRNYIYTGDPEENMDDADDGGREELYGHDDPAAGAPFDSDDLETSDYQPDFEWAREADDFPGPGIDARLILRSLILWHDPSPLLLRLLRPCPLCAG